MSDTNPQLFPYVYRGVTNSRGQDIAWVKTYIQMPDQQEIFKLGKRSAVSRSKAEEWLDAAEAELISSAQQRVARAKSFLDLTFPYDEQEDEEPSDFASQFAA